MLIERHSEVALCNHIDKFIYISGGLQTNLESNLTQICDVERYNLRHDSWQKLPKMNIARSAHSMLVLNQETLYIFCGYNTHRGMLNSIEKLSIDQVNAFWQIILVPTLIPRSFAIIAEISPTEVFILGGVQNKNFVRGDLLIYDTMKEKANVLIAQS